MHCIYIKVHRSLYKGNKKLHKIKIKKLVCFFLFLYVYRNNVYRNNIEILKYISILHIFVVQFVQVLEWIIGFNCTPKINGISSLWLYKSNNCNSFTIFKELQHNFNVCLH